MLKIDLSREYTAHEKTFSTVQLRKPKFPEFLKIGDIEEWQPNGQGGSMLVEYTNRIDEYLTLLCSDPGYECLADLDLCDQIKIKDEVKRFFTEARRRSSAQTD